MHEHQTRIRFQTDALSTRGWLVAGVSGRALAASAVRGGHRVVVLDCFADQDCVSHAIVARAVAADGVLRFDPQALLTAARELERSVHPAGLVYGSGFESRIRLLRQLGTIYPIAGNPPGLVRRIKSPAYFFPLLDRLGLPHPEIRRERPNNRSAWLVKQSGGAGGTHVRWAGEARPAAGRYFQRFETGRPYSALFLSNGTRARILGISRQWTAGHRPDRPFLFGGAVGRVSLPGRVRAAIGSGINHLVAATGLIGLNGLDFLYHSGHWSVLEINPRPPATFELYDPDYPTGLFDWQLRACRGELPSRVAPPRAARALQVVYARREWQSSDDFVFPRWCRDLPQSGLRFLPGDPVCTVHAGGPTPVAAMRLLRRRHARMQARLVRAGKLVMA